MTTVTPPRAFRALISATLGGDDGSSLLQDLDLLYAQRSAANGRGAATAWYARQAFSFVTRVGVRRVAQFLGGSDSLRADAAHAVRSFRHRPAFAIGFILTLAVGTGVLGTVYTAARWVLLKPVPGVGNPTELMTIRLGSSEAPPFVAWDVSHPDLLVLRQRLPLRGELAGASAIDVDLRFEDAEPRRIAGEMVSANYFSVLRAPMAAGRAFLPGDDDPVTGSPSVVLSSSLARSLRSGEPARLVGTGVRINGTLLRVVGVAGPGFRGSELPGKAELWLPLAAARIIDPSVGAASAARRDFGAWRRMIARPVAGIPTTTIESAANGIVAEVRTAFPIHSYPALHMRYFAHGGVGLDPGVRASVVRTLTLLAGAAGLLLILAIANLMNLSLVQSTLRRSSTAIRLALGASRGRIARALTVESLLLGVGGAGVALLCAVAWTRWFEGTRLNERGADLSGMHVDLTVVFVTIGAAVSAAMIAFIMPARLIRTQALDRLMRRGAGALPGAHRVRSVLVGVQVTVSVVLLVTAVLLGRTVDNLRNLELGFQPEPLLTFSLDPHLHGYESATLDVMARAVASRLAAIGAVEGAGFISPAPLGSGYVTASMYATADADASPVIGAGYFVTPGLLETLGVSVLAGNRSWSADSGTAVITRAMAARLFPGLPLTMLIDRTLPTRALGRNPVRIVAIIADVKLSDVTSAAPPMILRPLAERWPGMSVMGVVNTGRRPAQLAPLVTRVVRSTAPDLPVFGVRTAREAVDLQFAERGAMARAASTLGAIGLLLAALGLYGVLSHVVAARHREIGIRAALGATPAQIMGTVTRIGLIPVACGAIVGIAGAAAASRLLAAHLYDMDRFDPASYALSIVAIIVAAAAACLVPAYRAGRLSPVEVLREE